VVALRQVVTLKASQAGIALDSEDHDKQQDL